MPFKSLKARLKNDPQFNINKIEKAFHFAEKAHRGQKRKSGENYIFHPIEVAIYLTEYHANEDTIIAALLHDTVEDTNYTLEDIEKRFGKDVAQLIDGVTKFEQGAFLESESIDLKIESLRKWFEVMQQDIRVAIIKLVDRLHNMETLEGHKNEEKRRLIAKETLDVYVKIAFRLGINGIKEKLEQESLRYIDPKSYETLLAIQEKEFRIAKSGLNEVRKILNAIDKKNIIKKVLPQAPSLMKMHEKEVQLKEEIKGIMPLIYIINVEREEDCYKVLYYIHKRWRIELDGFVDYINTPDPGGYRGLHTRAVYKKGRHILFKIRTHEMEQYSEYGITLYCFSGKHKNYKNLDWLNDLAHITGGSKNHSQHFWEQLQHDILEAPIIINTALHDTLLLPANSTILDAAFYSYAQKAWKTEKIYLNGVKVPLYTPLKNNDQIHCYFKKKINIKYEWLGYVDTALASSCIREGLQALDEEKKVELGEAILTRELMNEGKGYIDEISDEKLTYFFTKQQIRNIKDLYKKIAEGELLPSLIINNLYKRRILTRTDRSSKKYIKIKGTFNAISNLLKKFSSIFEKGSYSIKNNGNESILSLKTAQINFSKWKEVLITIERDSNLVCLETGDCMHKIKLILAFVLTSFFWGLDPVVASQILQKTSVTPLALTSLRFWTVSIFSMIVLDFYTNVLRKNTLVSTKKFLSPFAFEFIVLSLCLLGTAISSYMSLSNGTLPMNYILALGIYMALFISLKLTKNLIKNQYPILALIYIVLGSGFMFLFWQPEWPIEGKFWTGSLVVFFSAYSFFNDHYKQKLRIFSRATLLQVYLAIYGSLFSLFFLFWVPWPSLTFEEYIFIILYASIFTGIPYLIYSYLIRETQNMAFIGYQLSSVFLVTFISTVVIEKTIHITPTVLMGLILFGLMFLQKILLKKEE